MSVGEFAQLSDEEEEEELVLSEDAQEDVPMQDNSENFLNYIRSVMWLVYHICETSEPKINFFCTVINTQGIGLKRVCDLCNDHCVEETTYFFWTRINLIEQIVANLNVTAEEGIINTEFSQELRDYAEVNQIPIYEDGSTEAFPFIFSYEICTSPTEGSADRFSESVGYSKHEDFKGFHPLRIAMCYGFTPAGKEVMEEELGVGAEDDQGFQIFSSMLQYVQEQGDI